MGKNRNIRLLRASKSTKPGKIKKTVSEGAKARKRKPGSKDLVSEELPLTKFDNEPPQSTGIIKK